MLKGGALGFCRCRRLPREREGSSIVTVMLLRYVHNVPTKDVGLVKGTVGAISLLHTVKTSDWHRTDCAGRRIWLEIWAHN